MKQTPTTAGYSLVEVLIAVSVLLITIVGPLTIASTGLKKASVAKEQNTAFFLAQEGLEAVVKAREDNALNVFAGGGSDVWNDVEDLITNDTCPANDPCGVDVANDLTLFACSSSTCDLYLHPTGRARYRHQVLPGTEPAYHREIVLSSTEEESYIRVQSTVTWGEATADETVSLSMYIYNIYAN